LFCTAQPEIIDLSAQDVTEVQAITTFVGEVTAKQTIGSEEPGYLLPSSAYTDVKEYLGRPYLIVQNSWPGVNRGDIWYSTSINTTFLSAFPEYSRLNGVFGFRATLRFRLQVAADPMQAGVLRMVWQPQADQQGGFNRTANAATMNQLPGVMLNIVEQTEAILEIPWVNTREFIGYAGDGNSFGTFTVYSFLPLTISAGTPNPNLSLWFSMHDIELFGAAAPSLSSQLLS
jgi:hypothetical protein